MLGKGNSNFTLASRSFGETPEGREAGVSEHTFHTLSGYFQDADLPSVPEGAGKLMPLIMYSISSLGVRLEWILHDNNRSHGNSEKTSRATDSKHLASLRVKQPQL